MNEEKKPKNDIIEIIIPDCCKEGWESCPHVAKKEKPRKGNIGL